MKRLIIEYVVLAAAVVNGWSANCTVGGTAIFFGNGVNVDQAGALGSLLDLSNAVSSAVNNQAAFDQSCFTYKLSYDSSFASPSTSFGTLYNVIIQAAAIAGVQVTTQFLSQLSQYLADIALAPQWLQQAIATAILDDGIIFQPDLQAHVSAYNSEITNGNSVIVIGHSQGNLYANQAYPLVSQQPNGAGVPVFRIVSVATPANTVAGAALPLPYTTLSNDLIRRVPGALSPNAFNGGPSDPCVVSSSSPTLAQIATAELRCHYFDTSYMAGINSETAIINNVVAAIPVPLGVTRTGSGNGRIVSMPAGIDCSDTQHSCIAAFSLGNVTLTAMPNLGSALNKWTGTCSTIGTPSGNSITFPIVNSLPSFPEDCSADFEPAPAVRLNPFGNQNGTVPYNVQVVNSALVVTSAPKDITVTLLREVFSECSGLLFSSNRTVVVSQGQSSATFNFDAGHDPNCNTLPITTVYTVTNAVLAPSTVLDLVSVPPQQLMLFSIH